MGILFCGFVSVCERVWSEFFHPKKEQKSRPFHRFPNRLFYFLFIFSSSFDFIYFKMAGSLSFY